MSVYEHPHRDVDFIIEHLLKFNEWPKDSCQEEINAGLLREVLDGAARLSSEVLAPLNQVGDRQSAVLSQVVEETPGFAEAYQLFREGGWMSLEGSKEFGGQRLPNLLSVAVNEIIQSANLAFGLCPMLSNGAIRAIDAHGSSELKRIWLPNLVSGVWTGTMNLTESGAGSDLAAIKTRAIPERDHYLLTGQKIFITWGDHSMTENIVHLVLARLPDAPRGVRGISLFLVPKFLLDADGHVDRRNDVRCVSLEHKLGIHGSPTCTMNFGEEGGAVGYLLGKPNEGLACMFTMMNHARQAVGMQGLGVSERSYQQARAYARERLQGTRPDGTRFAIIQFPDVRRMLLQMKASIEAMRALIYTAAAVEDRARLADSPEHSAALQARGALFTPIVKGWCTELAQEVTYLGIQIHGGMGYIEETGVAQFYRDARILTIYEGTTGIQATDFVGRKVLLDDGETLNDLLSEIEQTLSQLKEEPGFNPIREHLGRSLKAGKTTLTWMLEQGKKDRDLLNGISVPILMLFGYLCGGWLLAKSALEALNLKNCDVDDDAFLDAKMATAEFYAVHLLSRTIALRDTIRGESGAVRAFDDECF